MGFQSGGFQSLGFESGGANTPRLWYVIGTTAGWVDPTAAEVKAGTLSGGGAALDAGDEEAPTASTTYTFASAATGLTASTSYNIAFVWSDGTNNSNVAVGTFSTSAAGSNVFNPISGRGGTVAQILVMA